MELAQLNERSLVHLKIYLAKKGDTFLKVAEDFNVDIDILTQVNSQIAEPEMLMPGMKIKIPQKRKQVKNDLNKTIDKNNHKNIDAHDFSKESHQMPVIAEDDTWKSVPTQLFGNISIASDSRKYKTQQHKKKKKPTSFSANNTAFRHIRYNPINNIRNMPHKDTP